jgi:serine phosphatase RsbU (regulator of sigma subunit)
MDARGAVRDTGAEDHGATAGARTLALAQHAAVGAVPAPPPGPHRLFLGAVPFALLVVVAFVDILAPGLGFLPVLSVAPALAAISWRPMPTVVMGVLTLAVGMVLATNDGLFESQRGTDALIAIAGVTVAGVIASIGRKRREEDLANLQAIAEAAQQILLRPVPNRIEPVDIAVRYVSALSLARIGGDLYEAVAAKGCVRLIVGDVLGKGLPAARTAAVVLGAFREAAYDAEDLFQIAERIETSLRNQEATEEFVTAVLAEVSGDGCQVEILNCGHPEPLIIHDGKITAVESPEEAGLPLGLASLTVEKREVSVVPFGPSDRMLFYTDGITEARDATGEFYPLERSAALLGVGRDVGVVLDDLIGDVQGYVGQALRDDATLLLIGRS